MIPEALHQKLQARGCKHLDVGDVVITLATGKITRTIVLDGVKVANPVFPSAAIDWGIVEEAIP